MPVYRIKAWETTFEVRLDGKRPRKRLPWVCYPNEPGSTGLAMLLAGWSGAGRTGLALWPLLLFIVADLPAELRDGSLLRADGAPHTPVSIAARYRIAVDGVATGIDALLVAGWLVVSQPIALYEVTQNPRKSPEIPGLARAAERDVTGRDVTGRDEEQEHAPAGAALPSPAGPIAESTTLKPKAAPRTKLPELPWPDGWTFGDAEWEIANGFGAPSREAAALAFDAMRDWAALNDATSKRWNLRWSTWCRKCRDSYGWPKVRRVPGAELEDGKYQPVPIAEPAAPSPEEVRLREEAQRGRRTEEGRRAWDAVARRLDASLNPGTFRAWVLPLDYFSSDGARHYIAAPTSAVVAWVERQREAWGIGAEFVLVPFVGVDLRRQA